MLLLKNNGECISLVTILNVAMQVVVGLYAVVVVEYFSVFVLTGQTDQSRVLQVAQNV
jgi:hypothetical protein